MSEAASFMIRLAPTPDVVERRVGGQVFLLMADSTMHVFENDSAVFLWDALRAAAPAGRSVDELAGELVGEFDVTAARACADVTTFVETLRAAGVLVDASGDAT